MARRDRAARGRGAAPSITPALGWSPTDCIGREVTAFLAPSETRDRYARDTGSVAVLWCDIDRFKSINDAFGHAGGDALPARADDAMSRAKEAGRDRVVAVPATEALPAAG